MRSPQIWTLLFCVFWNPWIAAALDDSVWIRGGGKRVLYEVACNELQCAPAFGPAHSFAVVGIGMATEMQEFAVTIEGTANAQFDLVLYPWGDERTEWNRRVLTRRLLVKMVEGASAKMISKAGQAVSFELPSYAPGYVILDYDAAGETLAHLDALRARKDCLSVNPLLGKKRARKAAPNDPRYAWSASNTSYQWHLKNTGQNGGTSGVDANVEAVWGTHSGVGVRIGIVDDGLEVTHPDLAPNVDTSTDHNWNDGSADDPSPGGGDDHGTACAGVAAARGNNGVGVTGVAPMAELVGLRLISGSPSDADEAEAMSWLSSTGDIIEIKSNSWGPFDGGTDLEDAGDLVKAAFETSITNGRDGLGTIHVWAAGNGGDEDDDVNYDGYANSIYTIAVGATNDRGQRAYYSEPGAAMLVSAPSDGDTANQGITTTDLLGNGSYTDSFGGTSSATPLVSGVIALMLEENPNLGWRDVQEILIRSARKIDAGDAGWADNGAGLSFNHEYGGGLVDAQAAVTMAAGWVNLSAQQSNELSQSGLSVSIPDNGIVTRTFDFSGQSSIRVEQVTVTLDISHNSPDQLEIALISPDGTESILSRGGSQLSTSFSDWKMMSVHHWGEESNGTWTVRLTDAESGVTGVLNSVQMKMFGTDSTPVTEAPVLTNSATSAGNVGSAFSFQVTATNRPQSFTASNLPSGLTLNPTTGYISGTPTTEEVRTVALSATNAIGTGTGSVQITVGPELPRRPVITSSSTAGGVIGEAFSYQIEATENPGSFATTALPGGLSINTTTGVISGQPQQTGVFNVTLSAFNMGLEGTSDLTIGISPVGGALFNIALDESSLLWLTSGDADWFPQTGTSVAGGSCLQSGDVDDNELSVLSASVSGPGLMTFSWKVSSEEEDYDSLQLQIDGITLDEISGEVDWIIRQVEIPSGQHSVSWIFDKDNSESEGADAGYLDAVFYEPGVSLPPCIPVPEAVDYPGLEWTSLGGEWCGQALITMDGADAAESAPVGNDESTEVSVSVTGPGTVSFFWKASTEEGYDVFDFLIDNSTVETISGDSGWVSESFTVTAGQHTLTWRFSRDDDLNGGVDTVWLDQMVWTPQSLTVFDVWLNQNFTAAEQSDPVTGQAMSSPDGDRWSNLLEYAFGGNPLFPDEIGPVASVVGAEFHYTYTVDTAKNDLTFVPEESSDLVQWSPVTPELVSTNGGVQTWRVRRTLSGVAKMIRLKISR